MATKLSLFCIFICFVYAVSAFSIREQDGLEDALVVDTTAGQVRGISGGTTAGLKRPIYAFRGIPFAEPPTGSLRFKDPVAKKSWSGVLDVSKPGPICIQGANPVLGSEDCLYAKVYTSHAPNKNNNLPVMVWVYGGSFFTGAPDFAEHSPDYLLDQDVIVVSFHYRVGLFGFLSTGDSASHGNYGLKDQLLALQWIKANIKNFGGDPNKITLFSQSAGAASVAYLLQSEKAAGLFERVIMQSGHSLNQFSLSRQAADFASKVAGDLNVSTGSSSKIVDGLRGIPANTLQEAVTARYSTYVYQNSNPLHGLPIGPVLESNHQGAIVTGSSYVKLQSGNYIHVPVMIGHTSSESLVESLDGDIGSLLTLFDIQNSKLTPVSLNVTYLSSISIGGAIKEHYFGSKSIGSSDPASVNKFISDDQFERGIQEAANWYALKVPTYYYQFSYEGPLFGKTSRPVPGVGHTEDLGYLFDFGYKGSSADYLTRDRVVKMWTNFAKTGNPTPESDPLLNKITWPKNKGKGSVIQLDINKELTVRTNPNAARNNFWADLFAKNGRPPFNTY